MADKQVNTAAAGMLGLTLSANLLVKLLDAGMITETEAMALLSRALTCIGERDRPAAQEALLSIMPDLQIAEIPTLS